MGAETLPLLDYAYMGWTLSFSRNRGGRLKGPENEGPENERIT